MKRRRVLVTRAAEDAEAWAEALRAAGLEPVILPLLRFEASLAPAAVRKALASAGQGWVAITSPRAVLALSEAGPVPAGVRVAALGPLTAQRLRAAGIGVDLVGEGDGAAGLVRAFAARDEPAAEEARVLWLTGSLAAMDLGVGLKTLGFDVQPLEVYRTILRTPEPAERAAALDDLAAACFANPAAVDAFVAVAGAEWMRGPGRRVHAVAIGDTTAAAVARAGFPRWAVATGPSPSAVAEAALRALGETTP